MTITKKLLLFLRDLLLCASLYAASVAGGLFIILVVMSTVGYLPYSDRPGPGWHGGLHGPSLQEIGFYAGFVFSFVLLMAGIWGMFLFLLVRILGLLHMPRWFIGLLGLVVAGFVTLVTLAAAGWYISMAAAPTYMAAVVGALTGALLLPRFANSRPADTRRLWHWVVAPIPALLLVGAVLYPMLPDRDAQSLEVLTVRVVPSNDEQTGGAKTDLQPNEIKVLESLQLNGKLHFGSSTYQGISDSPKARVLIVFTGDLTREVALSQPKQTEIVYVQRGAEWKMYPPDAPTIRRKIRLRPSEGEFEGLSLEVEPSSGGSGFTWYPPIRRKQ